MSIIPPPTNSVPPVIRDSTQVRHFCMASPNTFLPRLNADLGTHFSPSEFQNARHLFQKTLRRDPTVGEVRLLDALARNGREDPACIAADELITHSAAIAEAWADIQNLHSLLHGAGSERQSNKAVAPPCTLHTALSLTGRYLHRADLCPEENVAVLSTPCQKARAVTEGYIPVARIAVENGFRSVWKHSGKKQPFIPPQTGDLLVCLPQAELNQILLLLEKDAAKARPEIGELRALAGCSLLLTALELAFSVDLYPDRLDRGGSESGRIPMALLCDTHSCDPNGASGYLLRIPVKHVQSMTVTFKELGIHSVVCGRVRAGTGTVIYAKSPAETSDVPVINLPSAYLRSAASLHLSHMTAEEADLPCPSAEYPSWARLPSAVPAENGMTPEGREAVALTRHEGRLFPIPEVGLLMSVHTVSIPHPYQGFEAASLAVNSALGALAECNISDRSAHVSVALSVSSHSMLTDGPALAVICGVHSTAVRRGVPVEDSTILFSEAEVPLTLTVTAWICDETFCREITASGNHQWQASGLPVHKESPAYVLPVLRRSNEGYLNAVATALNRNHGAACALRPLAINTTTDETTDAISHALHPDSLQRLLDELNRIVVPVISMNREDTRLLLSSPEVVDALRHHGEMGWSTLVLGESCSVFAENGLLPEALLQTRPLAIDVRTATVTYSFPAESVTRLFRSPPLAPTSTDEAMKIRHLLELHLPDGTVIPDGFISANGKILGLLNGLDTSILKKVQWFDFHLNKKGNERI